MNPQWFLIAIPVVFIIVLAVRITVLSRQHEAYRPAPTWQKRLLLTVSVVGIGIISIPLLSMPWYIPAGVAIWLGVSIATVPQEVSWLRTIGYVLQLVFTAVLMIAALVWVNSHM